MDRWGVLLEKEADKLNPRDFNLDPTKGTNTLYDSFVEKF